MYSIEYLDRIGGYEYCFVNIKGNHKYYYYTKDNKCYGLLPLISNTFPENNKIPYTFINKVSKLVNIDDVAYLLPLLYKINKTIEK